MTTIATNLAGVMADQGLNILLVDSDEEGLSTDWARARDSVLADVPEIVSLPTLMQLRQIAKIREQFDVRALAGEIDYPAPSLSDPESDVFFGIHFPVDAHRNLKLLAAAKQTHLRVIIIGIMQEWADKHCQAL